VRAPLLCGFLATIACSLYGQGVRSLGAPTAVLSHDFAHIAGMRELRDGRILISDDRDRAVVIADLAGETVRRVGREGAGPAEYARPGTLLAIANGGTLLLDPGNARFLEFGPTGQIIRAVSPTSRGRPQHLLALSAAWDARGTDKAGRIYFEQLPGPLRPGETRLVPIVRWDHLTGALDTVATYPLDESMLSLVPELHGKDAVIRPRAWPPRAQWAVAGDGRIALAQPSPYRLSWIAGRQRTDGPSVPYVPLRITAADRAAFLDEVRDPRNASRPAQGGGTPPVGGRTPLHKTGGEPLFPDTKPPFLGRDAVRVAPDGTVWVVRTHPASEPITRADLFDRQGTLSGQIVLPPRTRLLGFGSSSLYLARRDADDLEHLERYRVP